MLAAFSSDSPSLFGIERIGRERDGGGVRTGHATSDPVHRSENLKTCAGQASHRNENCPS